MAGIEAALTSMMQEHAHRRSQAKERAEKAKQDALAAAIVVAKLLVGTLNGDVHKSFQDEKQIASEAQALAATVQRFAKQTKQWTTMVNEFDMALKEIGDFENWITTIEYDCESIANAIRHISLISGRSPFT
ncbi:hypothetical protein L7F22_024757 [Adiantum nelumboides]|nr:hypothetical protein [Adiantum nelumboides]